MLTYDAVVDAIRQGIHEVRDSAVSTEEVSESTSLWSQGDEDTDCLDLDSLDLLELVVFLEEKFGWEIGEDFIDAESWRTVGDLAAVVMSIGGEAAPHGSGR